MQTVPAFFLGAPDAVTDTVFWQDAPGKIISQDLVTLSVVGMDWFDGPYAGDFNGSGGTQLIYMAPVVAEYRSKFIPGGSWPRVFAFRGEKYVDASREFPGFYDKYALPQLERALRKKHEALANPVGTDVPGFNLNLYERNLNRDIANLIMARDKIARVLGRDPSAGLAQAREWIKSSDPVLVDDARAVLADIGGHAEDAHAATVAVRRISPRAAKGNWSDESRF